MHLACSSQPPRTYLLWALCLEPLQCAVCRGLSFFLLHLVPALQPAEKGEPVRGMRCAIVITLKNLHQAYPHFLITKHTIKKLLESIPHCSLFQRQTIRKSRSNHCTTSSNDPIAHNHLNITLHVFQLAAVCECIWLNGKAFISCTVSTRFVAGR